MPDTESDWQAWDYSYSSIHSHPAQCGGWLSVWGLDASRMASSPSGGSSSFSPLGPSRGGPTGILSCHSVLALLPLGISTDPGGLGVECLQPSLDVSGKLHFYSSCISSSSFVQVFGGRCQRSTQTFGSGGTMLDGGSLALHRSPHVGRCSSVVSHHKTFCHGCFSRPGAPGSAIYPFSEIVKCAHVAAIKFLLLLFNSNF